MPGLTISASFTQPPLFIGKTEGRLKHFFQSRRSAEALVGRFNANPFAFKRTYSGKVVQVTGVVSTITEDGAWVALLAAPKLAQDYRGFQHYAYCKLADAAAIDKVASLEMGKPAKIGGVFSPDEPYSNSMTGLFVLKDCRASR